MLAGVGFVTALDVAEAVDVVDHHPCGAKQTRGRSIAEPVDALQACAVAEMKALHGVERLVSVLAVEKVVRTQLRQLALQILRGAIPVPVRRFEPLEDRQKRWLLRGNLGEPTAKAWNRR